MKMQGKCRVCGIECNKFYLQKGKIFCDECFIRYTNKAVRYKIKMRKINAILAKVAYVCLVLFAFVCGIAIR